MTLSRRAARRTALFLLYQWDVTGQPLTSLYEGEVDEFALETAGAVAARAAELDERISEAAEGWPADRLGAVERNVLRIAVHELDERSVPAEVAINEAVALAGAGGVSQDDAPEDAVRRAELLLERLEEARLELARISETGDTDAAIAVLGKLSELSRETAAELEQARREADAPDA